MITATATSFILGTAGLQVTDNDPPGLTVAITPSTFAENGGSSAATGMVTRQGLTTAAVTVNLNSSDTTEATVPISVMIAAGDTSTTFAVAALDDAIKDGPQTLTITASAAGFSSSSANVQVTDNDLGLMGFRLELQDASGNRIESLKDAEGNVLVDEDGDPILPVVVGDEFRVQVYVDDLRTVSDPQGGVFAGALDLAYSDPALFSLNGMKPDAFTDLEAFKSFFTTHSTVQDFGNGPVVVPMYSQESLKVYPSALNHDGETVPTQNEFDELQTFASAFELYPYGAGEMPFVYVTLKADSVGKLTFAGNPADATDPRRKICCSVKLTAKLEIFPPAKLILDFQCTPRSWLPAVAVRSAAANRQSRVS